MRKGILAILVIMVLIVGFVAGLETGQLSVAKTTSTKRSITSSPTRNTGSSTGSDSSPGNTISAPNTARITHISSGRIRNKNSRKEYVDEDPIISGRRRFKEILDIKGETKSKLGTVRKLLIRKHMNPTNFKRITQIIEETTKQDENKEILAKELLEMDTGFVARYHNRLVKLQSKKDVKKEVKKYIFEINNPRYNSCKARC